MDNFTHSLAGWALSRAGLAKKTGLATATLVIAANIPDIDAVATLVDGHQHLAIRRGITHGPIAMLILPLILAGLMIGFDNWQTKRGKRPEGRLPMHRGWLLALAYIGTLSHPALDFMNSYGVRLLEPFSSQWVYGDTLFIIDVWIWTALALGIWLSRKRDKSGRGNWTKPAIGALAAVVIYIAGNGFLTARTEYRATTEVENRFGMTPDLIVANPMPIKFWEREILWQTDHFVGFGIYDLTAADKGYVFPGGPVLRNMDSPLIELARTQNPDLAPFLFWSRMPYAEIWEHDGVRTVIVRDARFAEPMVGDRFTVMTELKN